MTNYNDGNWHFHAGGKCPVHHQSKGDLTYHDGIKHREVTFGNFGWSEPLMFRVVAPYVEPQEYAGECFAYHYTNIAPTLCGYSNLEGSVMGRYTATHVDGKLARIVWEAMK